jgi:lipoprotein-releasing system permease protein
MKFELFIAFRYLLSLRKQAFINMISTFAVLGVCLGVGALIIVMGVMNGFSNDVREKILGVNAHVVLTSYEGLMSEAPSVVSEARAVEGVTGATPFIYSEVMLSAGGGVKGVALRGVDPETAGEVLSIERDMVEGELADLSRVWKHPGIIVGQELAERLGLAKGSVVNLLSPTGEARGPAGFTPKVSRFMVVGVFRTGMFEYDSSMAYVSLPAARDLLGLPAGSISGLEIEVANVDRADTIADRLDEALGGFPYSVRSWIDMNANLFAALQLEKTAMFVILVIIILVGSFSIITTLVMLVMEKTRDIAVLMSMGATPGMIRRVFMLQGTLIGLVGTVLGYVVGVPLALLLKRYQFIELPSDVYPVDYLPVRLESFDMTIIGLAAFGLCFVATIYPALRAARLKPAEALRYE